MRIFTKKEYDNLLLSHGYNSILIDFSEIINDKGSLGFCILELLRGND